MLCKVLIYSTKHINAGNNITYSKNCKYRTTATLKYPNKLVCFRYIIVNTLHKNDKCDNNNNNNNNNNIIIIIIIIIHVFTD
jgi:hypothetical protein